MTWLDLQLVLLIKRPDYRREFKYRRCSDRNGFLRRTQQWFSLVRKVFEMTKESLDTYYDELGTTLGEALIAPTKIYVKALKSIKDAGVKIHACSHITGGGFYENVPRMLKEGTRAVIEKDSYPVLPIFKLLAKTGDIEEKMMYNTYNMGLGMVLAVDPADVDKTMEAIKAAGETPYVVGRIEAGEKGVTLC